MSFALLTRLPRARAEAWCKLLSQALDDVPILLGPPHGDPPGQDRAQTRVLFAADPVPGCFADWPGAGLVQSLWAGVDGLLADRSLPERMLLARMKDPALAASMAETVTTHVLSLHRQLHRYRAQAAERQWRPLPQPRPDERQVGLLGLGEMGRAAAGVLVGLRFRVAGWSRQARPVDGVAVHAGEEGLQAVLRQSQILVNLLPLTSDTRGLLDRQRLAMLPRGAALIQLGRGPHLVVPDLIQALDGGHLEHAILDVFDQEPLPPASPLWRHPAVTALPHVAAVTDPASAASIAARNARTFLDGGVPDGLVDRQAGY